MPYIGENRAAELCQGSPVEMGSELSYALSKLVADYVRNHGVRYATLAEVLAAFESAKREFQRRVVDPYEASKVASGLVADPFKDLPDA